MAMEDDAVGTAEEGLVDDVDVRARSRREMNGMQCDLVLGRGSARRTRSGMRDSRR
jgi:hypothetical protein